MRKPRIEASLLASFLTTMSREYDTFHEIEVDEKSTGPTRVLRTYGGLDSSTNNYFYHVSILIRNHPR